ncbi:MAG: hypothetical protein ACQEWM_03230 [Actinomycetota bacterium]
MRYTWDDGSVRADGERVADTDAAFWGRTPAVEIDGEGWAFRVQRDGMSGARAGDDGDAIVLERGAPWRARCRMLGPSGSMLLVRTTSWLLGRLHFDVQRQGQLVGEITPVGPWRYRPALELQEPLTHAEAVFLLWAASRIDASRPVRTVRVGAGLSPGAAGGV